MKKHSYRIVRASGLRMFVLVASLLILAGCGQTPESALVETDGTSNDSGLPSENGTRKQPLTESNLTQPAPIVDPEDTAVDVSAFFEAALDGKLEMVRQAIEAGVDVNATDDQLRTALLLASFNGHTPVVKLLIEQGASVSHRDAVGRTALMFAATGANEETVELLLDSGAENNAVDSGEGFTALMHAAAEGQAKVVQILLNHNADSAVRDADGDTARDFAARNGHAEVVRLLTK